MKPALHTQILSIDQVTPVLRDELFDLFAGYYDGVTKARFEKDLAEKDSIVVLFDPAGRPRGFSTQQILPWTFDGQAVNVLFSGDTIIEPEFWGSPALVKGWCQVAGEQLQVRPNIKLYWLLISKGYRTYLYLPLFFRRFLPRQEPNTPAEWTKLRDEIAYHKFGDAYCPSRGILSFPEAKDHLKPKLATIATSRNNDPNVRFFLQQNPQYRRGDELVCLAEISLVNTFGLGHRWLKQAIAQLAPA